MRYVGIPVPTFGGFDPKIRLTFEVSNSSLVNTFALYIDETQVVNLQTSAVARQVTEHIPGLVTW
jgi:hypothetical protein